MACCLGNERVHLHSFWQDIVPKETSLFSSNNTVLSLTKSSFCLWKSTGHCWGARWGWKKKKTGARFAALGTRTLQFLSQSSPSCNCDLGTCPRLRDSVSPSSQLSCLEWGDGGVNWDRPPGTADAQAAPRSRFTQFLSPGSSSPHLPTSSATGCLGTSLFPFPHCGVAPARPGAPHLCLTARKVPCDHPSLLRETSIYPSFSPWPFLLLRTPDIHRCTREVPTLALSQDPFPSFRRPPLHTAFTSGGALYPHTPILPQTLTYFHPPAFCGGPSALVVLGQGGGPPPPPPPGSGDPSHLRGERCVY